MKSVKIKNYFLIYIISLGIFVTFYLYFKHAVLNDSSISEWLINYQGGFTRRGLSGEILFYLSDFFNLNLRFAIFVTQAFFHLLFLYLLFIYLKDLRLNIIQIFALYTPIFLLYPVAEIEVLGRKEIILFFFFISLLFFSDKKFSKNHVNYMTFIFLPLICFIWEQVILFTPFIASVLIIKNKFKTFKETFLKTLLILFPSIVSIVFIFLSPLSKEGHEIMCNALLERFGDTCYMSAQLLMVNTVYFDTLHIHSNTNLFNYIRYLGIFLIGFLPLNYLLIKSEFILKDNFITKNFKVHILFLLLYLPSIIIFIYGWDWGRWINILYTYSILLYFYFYKNNLIKLKNENFHHIINYISGKKFLSATIFIIFAFGWHPKATLSEDIGSLPVYRIPYKATKFVKIIKTRLKEEKN